MSSIIKNIIDMSKFKEFQSDLQKLVDKYEDEKDLGVLLLVANKNESSIYMDNGELVYISLLNGIMEKESLMNFFCQLVDQALDIEEGNQEMMDQKESDPTKVYEKMDQKKKKKVN